MANIELSVDCTPVLFSIGGYRLDSSLLNTMCFEEGGLFNQGQYLNGEIGPENSAYVRRCLLSDRFIYAHAVITGTLDPKLGVRSAERILLMDSHTNVIVLLDSFE